MAEIILANGAHVRTRYADDIEEKSTASAESNPCVQDMQKAAARLMSSADALERNRLVEHMAS